MFEQNNLNISLCKKSDFKDIPDNWIYEKKYDGIRAISIDGELYNRKENGLNREISKQFPEIQPIRNTVLDGEIIAKDFKTILTRIQTQNEFRIKLLSKQYPTIFVVFDVLAGKEAGEWKDYRQKPLVERKKTLKTLKNTGKNTETVTYTNWKEGIWEKVTRNDWEGIIAKNPNSKYIGERNKEWLKAKNWNEEVFEIKETQITENEGFVIKIDTGDSELQKVVVNGELDQQKIRNGKDKAIIQYLEKTEGNRLRKPSFKGVK